MASVRCSIQACEKGSRLHQVVNQTLQRQTVHFKEGTGFGTETNRVTLIGKYGSSFPLEVMPKQEIATALLDRILTDCA